ncbi:hypothetical protein BLOT_011971 [Blomia tropicalis]|nr:hypothetical protein BLOT_011971 [Blomia tropicalis]
MNSSISLLNVDDWRLGSVSNALIERVAISHFSNIKATKLNEKNIYKLNNKRNDCKTNQEAEIMDANRLLSCPFPIVLNRYDQVVDDHI